MHVYLMCITALNGFDMFGLDVNKADALSSISQASTHVYLNYITVNTRLNFKNSSESHFIG